MFKVSRQSFNQCTLQHSIHFLDIVRVEAYGRPPATISVLYRPQRKDYHPVVWSCLSAPAIKQYEGHPSGTSTSVMRH